MHVHVRVHGEIHLALPARGETSRCFWIIIDIFLSEHTKVSLIPSTRPAGICENSPQNHLAEVIGLWLTTNQLHLKPKQPRISEIPYSGKNLNKNQENNGIQYSLSQHQPATCIARLLSAQNIFQIPSSRPAGISESSSQNHLAEAISLSPITNHLCVKSRQSSGNNSNAIQKNNSWSQQLEHGPAHDMEAFKADFLKAESEISLEHLPSQQRE
jgi:hypothetical protein